MGRFVVQSKPGFPIAPPIEPMLAKLAEALPPQGPYLYEPKWDGFRAIVFRGDDEVFIQSRDLRPLDRYFPELHDALLEKLPKGCVIDGEIVIATPNLASPSWRRRRRRPSSRSIFSPRAAEACFLPHKASAAQNWKKCWRRSKNLST